MGDVFHKASAWGPKVNGGLVNFSQSSGQSQRLDDGRPLFANFFNASAINLRTPSDTYRYSTSVNCITIPGTDCQIMRFETDVGAVRFPQQFAVRGYPEVVIAGSKWGETRESVGADSDQYTSSTGITYFDTTTAQNSTGYPVLAENVPSTIINMAICEDGHVGSERDVMLESWFHDICQDTGQGNKPNGTPIVGDLDNLAGTGDRGGHNNCLLEMMVHVGAVGYNDPNFTDSGMGTQNPAQYYIGGPYLIGGSYWELWAGNNSQGDQNNPRNQLDGQTRNGQNFPGGALVVWNRIGPAGTDVSQPVLHDLTAEGRFSTDWKALADFTRTNLKQILAAEQKWLDNNPKSQWMNPASPHNPFDRMNEPGCCAVGGIEVGLEPYLNAEHGVPIRSDFKELDLIVNGNATGPIPYKEECLEEDPITNEGCGLAFTLSPGGCFLPVTLVSCSLPVLLTGDVNYELDVATCDTCPCYLGPPIVINPGEEYTSIMLAQLADYSGVENPVITSVNSYRLSVEALLANDGSQVQVRSLAVPETTDEGFMQFSVEHTCNGQVTQCMIEVPVFVVPPTLAGSQGCDICVEAGEFAKILSIGVDSLDPTVQPLCEPSFGELVYENDGWIHRYKEGEFGVTEVIVPLYRAGNQAKKTQRRVRICVKPPNVVWEPQDGCRSILEVKPCYSTSFVPVGRITSVNMSSQVEGASTYTSLVTKQRHSIAGGAKTISLSVAGELELGGSQSVMQVDELIDARIRTWNANDGSIVATFAGTMRVGSFSTPFTGGAKQTFSVSLESEGQCQAQQMYGQL